MSSAVYYFRVAEPTDTTLAAAGGTKSISANLFQIIGDLTLNELGSVDQTYQIGDAWQLDWTKIGQANATPNPALFDNVSLQYSNDSFASDNRLVQTVAISGASSVCAGNACGYGWTIPYNAALTSTAAYKLRVIDPHHADDC
jgi:hypothetical protein